MCSIQSAVRALLRDSVVAMFRELPESSESECLGSMTPETQDIYLRMDHHRRRSGYRLGRIIARQQLLKKIAGGMKGVGASWRVTTDSYSRTELRSFGYITSLCFDLTAGPRVCCLITYLLLSLCSLQGTLRMTDVVDQPWWKVFGSIPQRTPQIFEGKLENHSAQ